jgi:hypothetical protein
VRIWRRATVSDHDRPFAPLYEVKEKPVNLVNLLIVAALVTTVVVLVLGLRSMVRGGEYEREHSEKFMWERVGLQALVIVMLIAAIALNL